MSSAALKRVNVYVNPDDLKRVARELGCKPSDAIRQLIDNYLFALEVDEIRRLPSRPVEDVYRQSGGYELSPISEGDEIEPVA